MNQYQYDILDIISVVSFVLQLQNNSELRKQTSNDEVIKHLHDDIVALVNENRELSQKIIYQNEVIIRLLEEGK